MARKESGVLLESAAATTAGFSSCVSFFSTHAGAIFTTGAISTWHQPLDRPVEVGEGAAAQASLRAGAIVLEEAREQRRRRLH